MFKGILFSASVLIGGIVMAQDAKAVLDKVSQNEIGRAHV